jgi:hypothetical protein
VTDPHLLRPDHAPTPFTADEIRRGCPPGRTIRLRVEAAGADPVLRVTRFRESDDDGAVQEGGRFTLEGLPLETPHRDRTRWAEFQAHASFPADRTRVDRVDLDTPMGSEECLRYTVGDDEAAAVFWFATARPGMPVRVEERRGGETVFTMTMIEDTITALEEDPWPT